MSKTNRPQPDAGVLAVLHPAGRTWRVLVASTGVDNPLKIFIAAVPLNFYALAAIVLAGVVVWKPNPGRLGRSKIWNSAVAPVSIGPRSIA